MQIKNFQLQILQTLQLHFADSKIKLIYEIL